jgi:D-sedoheptulose 7-phosphate isomerase
MKSLQEYNDRINQTLSMIPEESCKIVLEEIKRALNQQSSVYLIGNGGSAATASHFATDLHKTKSTNNKYGSAISLCDNSSLITAISNDESFDSIFINQLRALAKPGDVLVSISASGNSINIVRAVEWANDNELITISLVGFDGGALLGISKIALFAPTEIGGYGVAEDCHSILCHFLTEELRRN